MPAFNAERFIGECIDSVIGQTFRDWNLVVVDDGSTDRTVDIARSYESRDERIRTATQPNSGVAVARNRGMEIGPTNARYIMFLDHDDYLEADSLVALISALDADKTACAAYGLPRDVDQYGTPFSGSIQCAQGYNRNKVTPTGIVEMGLDEPTDFACLVLWPCIITPGQVLIRADALEAVGGFDQEVAPSDDWDLFLRLCAVGHFKYLPRYIINKRHHADNVSDKGKVMAVAEPALRNKLASGAHISPELRFLARLGHRYSCQVKLSWARSELGQHKWIGALKAVLRAIRSYVRYMRTVYLDT